MRHRRRTTSITRRPYCRRCGRGQPWPCQKATRTARAIGAWTALRELLGA